MESAPFAKIVPEIGLDETREVEVIVDCFVPKDVYGFVEMYCMDPDCDCRKVILQIFSIKNNKFIASIDYGWESREFYAKWLSVRPDSKIIDRLVNPSLNPLGPTSSIANGVLQLVTENITPFYIERLKKHYKLFKSKLKKPEKKITNSIYKKKKR